MKTASVRNHLNDNKKNCIHQNPETNTLVIVLSELYTWPTTINSTLTVILCARRRFRRSIVFHQIVGFQSGEIAVYEEHFSSLLA